MAINREKSTSRKRYWVHSNMQFRYLTFIALGMAAPLIIVTLVLFAVFWQAVAAQMAIPEGVAQFILPALKQACVVLLILLPVVCALIFWAALVISNRIAGPLKRIERELGLMAQGAPVHVLKVRQCDELVGLVDAINQIIQRSRKD